jgi:hypothetical protein
MNATTRPLGRLRSVPLGETAQREGAAVKAAARQLRRRRCATHGGGTCHTRGQQ